MKGYNDRKRKLFVRVTACVLAGLMILSALSVLIFNYAV